MSSQVHGCAALYPEFGAVSRFIQSSSDGDGREHLTNTHMAPRGNYSTKKLQSHLKNIAAENPRPAIVRIRLREGFSSVLLSS
jgi:hypothetical protein